MNLTDTDGDSRTNLEELARGFNPRLAAPEAPQNFSAAPGSREVRLTWEPVAAANSYIIYSKTSGKVTTDDPSIANLIETSFTHTGLSNGTTYSYIVTAYGPGGESPSSREIPAIPNFSAQAAQKLLAQDAQASDQFGSSVSISGDDAIVGALFGNGGTGTAYIHWSFQCFRLECPLCSNSLFLAADRSAPILLPAYIGAPRFFRPAFSRMLP